MHQALLKSCVSLAVLGVAGMSAPAFADDQKTAAGGDTLGEIVVTAVKGSQAKLNTSVSISSVSNEQIANFNPTSDAELMRFLPGIQVPGNGGPGGNANINIRGLQTLSGGSPFLQVQEDGLPVVLTGDMAFANNDYFTHVSPTDDRVEAIRGGSASTLASQAVGGVVNYVSKTRRDEGGFLELEEGLTYDYTKVKGLLSGSVNDSTYYTLGGYFDIGHGTRHAGWNVSDSHLIKGNITKEFGDGGRDYIRFLFKIADTQEPDYNAGLVSGVLSGNAYGGYAAVPGYDYRKQAGTYSIFNRDWTIVNYDGTTGTVANLQKVENNGVVTHQKLFQLQAHYNVNDAITVDDNGRVGLVNGYFATGFFGASQTGSLVGSKTAGGDVIGSFIYANGPKAGQLFTGAFVNANTDIYTRFSNLNSVTNDLTLSGKFQLSPEVKANVHAGWFYYDQKADFDWHPNNTYADGTTGANPAMLDPVSGANGTGNLLAAMGQAGYNNNWGTGTCCAQQYALDYSINAPYANLILDYDKVSLDASIREELFHYSGTQWGGNGSGTVSTVNVQQVDPRTNTIVTTAIPYGYAPVATYYNFNEHATNWSVGLLYKFSPTTTAFFRAAHGVRFNADRIAWTGVANGDGSLNAAGQVQGKYPVDQYEVGVKSRGNLLGGHYTVEATVYHSKYTISSFGVGSNCLVIDPTATVSTVCTLTDTFKDWGYELFATYGHGGFKLVANLTGDFSKYQPFAGAPQNDSPLAHLAYTVQASYTFRNASALGVSVTGNTSTPAYVGATRFTYPGSAIFTAFGRIGLTKNLQAGIDVYNLFNTVAVQGGQPGTAGGGYYNATVADGRTVKGSIKLTF